MRKRKVKYEVTDKKQEGIYRFSFFSSEIFEAETIDEAIEYSRKKADELDVHFYGVDERKA